MSNSAGTGAGEVPREVNVRVLEVAQQELDEAVSHYNGQVLPVLHIHARLSRESKRVPSIDALPA